MKKLFNHSFFKLFKTSRGFTLYELMFSMFLIVLLSGLMIFKQNKWNDRLAVSTQAYDVILMLRQAQFYSLDVKENQVATGDKFAAGYGVHFNMSLPSEYIFYADRNKNRQYDAGEALETKTLNNKVTISRICGNTGGCSNSTGATMKQVSISFMRPDPQAIITYLNNANGVVNGVTAPASVYLLSSAGVQFVVRVETNGQISLN